MSGTGTVRLLCQPDCAKCAAVRRWLDGLGLEVQVTDVTTDEAAQRELVRRGIRSLPVVVTPDGKAAWGVEPERLSAALPLLAGASGGRRRSPPEETTFDPGEHQTLVARIDDKSRVHAENGR
jgi:glutaredoxin